MTDTSDITDAAIAEALKRVGRGINAPHIRRYPEAYPAHLELARMIQKYEPPVDRAEELFRKMQAVRFRVEDWHGYVDENDRAAIELLRQHMKDEA